MDDKYAVVLAVTAITITAMIILGAESKEIIGMTITGLMGIAVGKGA